MKKSISLRGFSAYRLWSQLPSLEVSHLPDVIMFAAAIALFYGSGQRGTRLVRPLHAIGGNFAQSVGVARLRGLFASAHHDCLRIEPRIHASLRLYCRIQPAR